ncbi:MAG: chalcone isomerase family protein [Burkholderiaceae bacterium]|nr:chalcone isomerase family protein [Burkholderiaceae bacterium]MDH3461618.1 chalcone isomerase family protein [Burkholderiaceae bacterium]
MIFTGTAHVHVATLALASLFMVAAGAAQIEGHHYDERIRLSDTELVLNGVGVRAVLWLKGYTAALYMTEKAATPGRVLAVKGPKRVQMRLLLAVEAKEFIKAFSKGIRRNVSESELAALNDRMQQFNNILSMVGSFNKGDIANLDFIPELGLVLTVNGKARGDPIPGEDLYAALLKIFVGERPVDQRLKTGLLGAVPG